MQTKLLTPSQTAEILGVQEQTLCVWRSTRRAGPPFIKVGRAVRYDPADVQRYIATRTVQIEPTEARA